MSTTETCEACAGTGLASDPRERWCRQCGGHGRIVRSAWSPESAVR